MRWIAATVLLFWTMVDLTGLSETWAFEALPDVPQGIVPQERMAVGRHHLWVNAGWRGTGQPIRVPVIVIEGAEAGKSLLLTAAVHGDELNGIDILHRLADRIDPRTLAGRLIMVPGLNQPGMEANNRHFVSGSGGGTMSDLNRRFPGKTGSGRHADRYLAAIWSAVIDGRVDMAIDLHTQTRGGAYPLFVFADFRNMTAKQIAYDLMPDVIKDDKGEKGTLETVLVEKGIPAVTLEVGEPKRFQAQLGERSVAGILNVMARQGMIEREAHTAEQKPYVGDTYVNVLAETGGIARMGTVLGEMVEKGDVIAHIHDPFGRLVRSYEAPVGGYVLSVATDPLREPGSLLVRILYRRYK